MSARDGGVAEAESPIFDEIERLGIRPAAERLGLVPDLSRVTARRAVIPVRWRELLGVVLIVVLCDGTIYRGEGFAGLALFVIACPLLLLCAAPQLRLDRSLWVVTPLLFALAARLLWCGSGLAVAAGAVLVLCFAMSLAGFRPYLERVVAFAFQSLAAGARGLRDYVHSISFRLPPIPWAISLGVILPVAALSAFSLLFLRANPDVWTWFTDGVSRNWNIAWDWVSRISPMPRDFLFWGVTAWIAIGLLRPFASLFGDSTSAASETEAASPEPAALYFACRNTLVAVIGLFALYLAFEFSTLWFRTFPKGFHYSGYAHEGAFWLTVALALATGILSVIFRGAILRDPRLKQLRLLSWIWSAENLLLALAVFHRLFIYIEFNGMTRMRVVGILGVAAVVAGFGLVLWKISRNESFGWLMRRQAWAVGLAVYLYAVLPVDWLVNRYNVDQVLAGNLAPSVQIIMHSTSAEGLRELEPLTACPDETIREGIRAMLADQHAERERQETVVAPKPGWTAFQIADRRLLNQLRSASLQWGSYADPAKRAATMDAYRRYAYQWW